MAAELSAACGPGLCTHRVFPSAGHLDFTLGIDDDIISHVLAEMCAPAAPRGSDGGGNAAGAAAVPAPLPRGDCHALPPHRCPFLFSYTKLEAALRGLGAHTELGPS